MGKMPKMHRTVLVQLFRQLWTDPVLHLMWDALLYTANMCCFYFLMNKDALVYDMAEYS